MTEMASEVREGLDNLADAVRTAAGALATIAAGMNTDTLGDQRNMGGVFYTDASERFSDVLKKLSEKDRTALENYITDFCKAKRR